MNRHDTKEKTVLGKTFAANGGYEEGVAAFEYAGYIILPLQNLFLEKLQCGL